MVDCCTVYWLMQCFLLCYYWKLSDVSSSVSLDSNHILCLFAYDICESQRVLIHLLRLHNTSFGHPESLSLPRSSPWDSGVMLRGQCNSSIADTWSKHVVAKVEWVLLNGKQWMCCGECIIEHLCWSEVLTVSLSLCVVASASLNVYAGQRYWLCLCWSEVLTVSLSLSSLQLSCTIDTELCSCARLSCYYSSLWQTSMHYYANSMANIKLHCQHFTNRNILLPPFGEC